MNVVTFEFENVPAAAAAAAAEQTVVRPGGRALEVAQHRVREKTFLASHGLPVTPFAPVSSDSDLAAGIETLGRPAVLKTVALGYDGKGQTRIDPHTDLAGAWKAVGRQDAILEAFIDLDCEISIIGARGADGSTSCFGPIRNTHKNHILDISVMPAGVPRAIASQAVEATLAVMSALEYVGILCVEFFVSRDGKLMINELAPRPHNSGHLTFDACRTSQFEQQLRAVCGLPLGSPELLKPAAAMANLLGDLWSVGEPDWAAALAVPEVKLHLYGKKDARPGRKMGHLTAMANAPDEATDAVLRARAALTRV